MATLLSEHMEIPLLVADKPCGACGNPHKSGKPDGQHTSKEKILNGKTQNANVSGLLTIHFVPGKVILYRAQGWKIKDGKAVLYGSLTFIKNHKKVFELSEGVPFDFSGGTITRWIRKPVNPDDILSVFTHPEEKCIWKNRWSTEEILAANNMP